MKQLLLAIILLLFGLVMIVCNRSLAEEGLRWWWSLFWRPSLMFARSWVIVWGVVAIFLALVIVAHALL